MKKIIYFLIYLLPLGILGQSITVIGSVIDLKDGNPIPGASIIEKGTHQKLIAQNGHYKKLSDLQSFV